MTPTTLRLTTTTEWKEHTILEGFDSLYLRSDGPADVLINFNPTDNTNYVTLKEGDSFIRVGLNGRFIFCYKSAAGSDIIELLCTT